MALPRYGTYRRTHKRINVLRGYPGNESTHLTRAAKPKLNEAILSGMVISLDTNGEWVKGCANNVQPYLAMADQSDTDVVASGLLLGLSCSGDFEVEVSTYKTDTYPAGWPLQAGAGGDAGLVVKTAGANLAAAMADAGDFIGFVTKGLTTVSGSATTTPINTSWGTEAGPNKTLTFVTRWTPKVHA